MAILFSTTVTLPFRTLHSYASGPDGLNNRVLQELASELSVPLCSLFKYSLNIGSFPYLWKDANVSSIPPERRPLSVDKLQAYLFTQFPVQGI